MKNNVFINKFNWIYLTGFFIILFLPILTFPPWFFPPDWAKTIIFRSILSILILIFIYQLLYQRNSIQVPIIRNNAIFWGLIALFSVFLISTIFSVDMRFSLWGSPIRGGGFINFGGYIVFSILAFIILKSHWQKIWDFSIIIGILVSFVAIIQFFGLFNTIFINVDVRPPSTLGNPDFLAVYMLLLFFPTLYFSLKESFDTTKSKIKKVWYLGALLLFSYTIVIAGSRAAFLGLIIGSLYFILFNPKKLKKLKIISGIILAIVIGIVIYANTGLTLPTFLENNRSFQSMYSRLSIRDFLSDARFSGWTIATRAFKEKPIIGWGPENFSVGFNKHYDPSLPHIDDVSSNWWDRAHSIFFDIAVQAGIIGILVYFSLIALMFWHLQKIRVKSNDSENKSVTNNAHILQTAIVAYVTANLFSFDSFSSYIIFFLIVGNTLYLYSEKSSTGNINNNLGTARLKKWGFIIMLCLIFLEIIFLWRYNIKPMQINKKINIANELANPQGCDRAVQTMESIMLRPSILDARVRMQYVDIMRTCADLHPQNGLTYALRGIEAMQEAVLVQPLYSRLWIFLGAFTTVKASNEKDLAQKTALLNEADSYFEKASQLSPGHHEIIIEQTKMYMIARDWKSMEESANLCENLYPDLGECNWHEAVAQIHLQKIKEANDNISITKQKKNFNTESIASLNQLANAYADIKDYQSLVITYEKLINLSDAPDYHSSLAFVYRELGRYEDARYQAMVFLRLMPEAKEEVDQFLSTLPH